MEYKVWQYDNDFNREILRESVDDKELAINLAEFWKRDDNYCIVYEDDYEGLHRAVYTAGRKAK